jgi:hypothetical protein
MSQYPIVIIDTDQKRTDFFESRFLRDEHHVDIYNDINTAVKNSVKHKEAAFLVEYNTLTISDRLDVIKFYKEFTRQNVFMFNVPDNANKRLAFYELGAKRVFDDSQPLDEIYYGLKWPLSNMLTSDNKNVLISSGTLEDVSLNSLLATLAREQRTGILKIVTPYNSGKIYFKDGYIIHAQVGLLTGEPALMHMLFWNSGSFSFGATSVMDENETVRISKVALLCMAENIRKEYLNNLQKIGSQNAIVQVKFIDSLKTLPITLSENFKELVARPTLFSKVLENSIYSCYDTAEKLVTLKEEGFLFVNEPDNKEIKKARQSKISQLPVSVSALLSTKEAEELCSNIGIKSGEGKVFIISTKENDAFEFLNCIVRNNSEIIKLEQLSICKTELANKESINFFGLQVDEQIIENIEKYSERIKALVFIIDPKNDDNPEYSRYVITRLTTLYNVPWITVSAEVKTKKDIDKVKIEYGIAAHIPLLEYNSGNKNDVKTALMSIKTYVPEKKEEKQVKKE